MSSAIYVSHLMNVTCKALDIGHAIGYFGLGRVTCPRVPPPFLPDGDFPRFYIFPAELSVAASAIGLNPRVAMWKCEPVWKECRLLPGCAGIGRRDQPPGDTRPVRFGTSPGARGRRNRQQQPIRRTCPIQAGGHSGDSPQRKNAPATLRPRPRGR